MAEVEIGWETRQTGPIKGDAEVSALSGHAQEDLQRQQRGRRVAPDSAHEEIDSTDKANGVNEVLILGLLSRIVQ